MSHFTVLIIGKNLNNQDELEKALMPYHEFECTGYNNEYVQNIDKTQEYIDDYAQYKATNTDDEFEYPTIKEYIEEYMGCKTTQLGEIIDCEDAHKFGYAIFDGDKLVKAIERTNPNCKWDWYKVGGRWLGALRCTDDAHEKGMALNGIRIWMNTDEKAEFNTANIARFDHIDFAAMKKTAENYRRKAWNEAKEKLLQHMKPDEIDANIDLDGLRYKILQEFAALRKRWEEENRPGRLYEWIKSKSVYPEEYYYSLDTHVGNSASFEKIEDWIKAAPPLSTFALLDEKGWQEKGEMGWWGMVSNEKNQNDWDAFLAERIARAEPDDWFAIVDCHI